MPFVNVRRVKGVLAADPPGKRAALSVGLTKAIRSGDRASRAKMSGSLWRRPTA